MYVDRPLLNLIVSGINSNNEENDWMPTAVDNVECVYKCHGYG